MKKINILKTIGFIVFLGMGTLSYGQSVLTSDQSAALKTIRTVDDIPVVYQTEIKGGLHQYDTVPWEAIPLERITLGMIARDNSKGTSYRYVLDYFPSEVAEFNRSTDWEVVMIPSMHSEIRTYSEGEIVVSGDVFYIANTTINGSLSVPISITNAGWTPLSTDDQQITDLSLDVDTLSLTLEAGGTATLDLSHFKSQFRVNDQVTPSAVVTYKSGGTEIVLIDDAYELPAASTMTGATVTVKNIKLANATETAQVTISPAVGEDIDGSNSGVDLFRQYDYITVVSDGSQWFKVAEGSTKVAQKNASATDNDHLDAFYWGAPDVTGSWRIIYSDASNRLLIQRLKADGTWKTKTSIVP